MDIVNIPLAALRPHAMNANVMPADRFEKLVEHIERSGRYPPLIVRPLEETGVYELLDGHHRRLALDRLGHTHAACAVWDCDDTEAMILLTTLNRLQGADDPVRRGRLLGALADRLRLDVAGLAAMLPETAEQVAKLRAAASPAPAPARPTPPADLPVAVHFFLKRDDRDALEAALRKLGGRREDALMRLVSPAFSGGATPRAV